jgi:shikimate dehydrogenase
MPAALTLCGSLSQVASPLGRAMHEAAYRVVGIAFTYVPFEVQDLPGALTGMRALGVRGFGVSQPFKEQVIPLLDRLDAVAERIGAVNTIVNEGVAPGVGAHDPDRAPARLVGHNTDWVGATRALEEVRTLAGARVLLLGAGGAARAIAFGLRERGAVTTLANRDRARAERLAALTGAHVVDLADAARVALDHDVLVNATSIGQTPRTADMPLPETSMRTGQVVMDIVYKPLQTAFTAAARARGATAIEGARMLLHQAAAQFELYTGRPAPLAAMDAALRATIG